MAKDNSKVSQRKTLRERLFPAFIKLDGAIKSVCIYRHESATREEAQHAANVTQDEWKVSVPFDEFGICRELYVSIPLGYRGKHSPTPLGHAFGLLADEAGDCLGEWTLDYGISKEALELYRGRWRWLIGMHDVARFRGYLESTSIAKMPTTILKPMVKIDWTESEEDEIRALLKKGHYQTINNDIVASAVLSNYLGIKRDPPRPQAET